MTLLSLHILVFPSGDLWLCHGYCQKWSYRIFQSMYIYIHPTHYNTLTNVKSNAILCLVFSCTCIVDLSLFMGDQCSRISVYSYPLIYVSTSVGVKQQKCDGHVKSDKEFFCVEKNLNSQFHVLFLTQYVR